MSIFEPTLEQKIAQLQFMLDSNLGYTHKPLSQKRRADIERTLETLKAEKAKKTSSRVEAEAL